ncbi:type 4a pilus biogenesis protein PilO [Salinicola rhizosphaerae]|uniref:Type 4 fimbrial biogenesis protein PilO n=1 Tax=Salinicola rhizosphaerae TaxID=1443141 RepID=A0ABQ3E1H3_9GAMM|nr:type 4a pilus biogenesis protein PilO [Salinicola rhizosphaerae]GHB20434.1 type 4 fimbrial biogenesis protein PilO [Salinicola rhizosphaerae]
MSRRGVVGARLRRVGDGCRDQWRQLRELPWRELDVKEAGSWPLALQGLVALAALVGAAWLAQWLLAASPREMHHRLTAQEAEALTRFETLSYQAVNLPAMQAQMDELQARMQRVLERLPSDAEVPALLDAISDAAREQQLDIDSLKLRPTVEQEFYLEQPFDIQVRGDYHQIAAFLARVAAMPRIVTLHDFTLTPVDDRLRLAMVAKTYRYREDTEDAARGAAQRGKS